MSDTPETDRRIIRQSPRMCGCGYESEIVFADFARRLESERNAAIPERDRLITAIEIHRAKAFPLTGEDFDQELWGEIETTTNQND